MKIPTIKIILMLFSVLAVSIGLSLIAAWPFMWIWNYAVVGALAVANPITYWIAFWLMMFWSVFLVGSQSKSS